MSDCAVKSREILLAGKSFFYFLTKIYGDTWTFVAHLTKNQAFAVFLQHFRNNVERTFFQVPWIYTADPPQSLIETATNYPAGAALHTWKLP